MRGLLMVLGIGLSVVLVVNTSWMSATVNPWLMISGGLQPTTLAMSEKDVGYPLVLRDPVGRDMTLTQPPVRIVSTILAGDEMLMMLAEHQQIVSVTYLVDQPEYPHMNGVFRDTIRRNHADIETILSLDPDLVLIGAYSNAATVELLLAADIPVVRFAYYHRHQDLRDNVRLLARILNVADKGEQWIADMDHHIRTVQDRVSGLPVPRVLYYSVGGLTRAPGTLMDESITYAGGYNVVAETGLTGYTRIAKELAIGLLPEVILLDDRMAGESRHGLDQLMNDPAWADVPAVINGRVYREQDPLLLSVTPTRVKGLASLSRRLHPSAFELPVAMEQQL